MSTERQPSSSEILDLMDRLQRDEGRRNVLASSWELYEAAVDEGVIGRGGIDLLARCMQELHGGGLIAFATRSGAAAPRQTWDGAEIQQLHQWRVTADGRRDASLFRAEAGRSAVERSGPVTLSDGNSAELHDVFIAHASEDKDEVAGPLAKALISLGWSVWLDELQLTIGDSLSRRIDAALTRSRFGVVILSPAFFAKEWPQRELAGLAARELASGSKVILPVWHNVDHGFIAERSPTLADRLGALTSKGIDRVAQEVSRVLDGQAPVELSRRTTSAREEPASQDYDEGTLLHQIPVTDAAQADLIGGRPRGWEYRLYAAVLLQGRIGLEDKWHDHELRLPRGPRRSASEPAWEFLGRETGEIRRFIGILDRLFDPEVLEQAFRAPGDPGDPQRIIHVARGVVQIYESMMDWAAELRNTSVPDDYEEVFELAARMADGPIRQNREFIQLVGDRIARLPILVEEAEAKGATTESPMELELALNVALDPENQKQLLAALDRLRAE